jgi:hypothetical protein
MQLGAFFLWYNRSMGKTPEETKIAKRAACRKYYKEHIEQERERSRKYSKEHIEQERERSQRWRKLYPDQARNAVRRAKYKRKYGITTKEAEQLLIAIQTGVCAICGGNRDKRRLHIDHDHNTGKIRGILCGKCNRGLGHFADNSDWLHKAGDYIKDSGKSGIP